MKPPSTTGKTFKVRNPEEKYQDAESRFWAKVDKRDTRSCWEWKACTIPQGYGQFRLRRQMVRAHRYSYYLEYGEWPKICRHTCDNPSCVNPAHLRNGTVKDNIEDMYRRDRAVHVKGENHGRVKVKYTEDFINTVRCLRLTSKETAKLMGISASTVRNIRNKRHWWFRHEA